MKTQTALAIGVVVGTVVGMAILVPKTIFALLVVAGFVLSSVHLLTLWQDRYHPL
jgi:hypothetical protein